MLSQSDRTELKIMTETSAVFNLLGSDTITSYQQYSFLEWCVVQTVRPAFAHALSTHDLLAEGRLVMAASRADQVADLAGKIAEEARATMFRQLAPWIKR